MGETDKPKPRRWAVWIVILMIVVFVIYPLSSGPAFVLCWHGYMSFKSFAAIYRPVISASEALNTNEAFAGYQWWWLRITGGDVDDLNDP